MERFTDNVDPIKQENTFAPVNIFILFIYVRILNRRSHLLCTCPMQSVRAKNGKELSKEPKGTKTVSQMEQNRSECR